MSDTEAPSPERVKEILRRLSESPISGRETQDVVKIKDATLEGTEAEKARNAILEKLDALGGGGVSDGSIKFQGDAFVVPAGYSGDLIAAADHLRRVHEQEEKAFAFSRVFDFRPWDGAAAFDRAMIRVFGSSGLGKDTPRMFGGSRPPHMVSISTGPGTTVQVPWGEIAMPLINAVFTLDATHDREKGMLFVLHVKAPRKYRARLEGFFDVVRDELEKRSIYKGKAFNGAGEPDFLDLSWVDPEKVYYSDTVLAELESHLWSVIRYRDAMVQRGMPVRRAVLLEGPYGTGKTLAAALTAREAQQNGWTFIQVRPGVDDVFEALQTAQLYAPCVVHAEDIETLMSDVDDEKLSKILDVMDGIGNKSSGVVLVATTNHVAKLPRGVMRPGRLDAVIHIGELDRSGVEKLIRGKVGADILDPDANWDAIAKACAGFLPAFVSEAADRAVRVSMARNAGTPATIETADLVLAADGLRHQLNLMNAAAEGASPPPALDAAVSKLIEDVVYGTRIIDSDGDAVGQDWQLAEAE